MASPSHALRPAIRIQDHGWMYRRKYRSDLPGRTPGMPNQVHARPAAIQAHRIALAPNHRLHPCWYGMRDGRGLR